MLSRVGRENIVKSEGFGATTDVEGLVDDEMGFVGGSYPDGNLYGCLWVHIGV